MNTPNTTDDDNGLPETPAGRRLAKQLKIEAKQALQGSEKLNENDPKRQRVNVRIQGSSQLVVDVKFDALLAFMADQNEILSFEKISVNDLIIRAVAVTLAEVPSCNLLRNSTKTKLHPAINIAMMMESGKKRAAPVIKSADKKPVLAISRERQALLAKAKVAGFSKQQLNGATFTLFDLSNHGIKQLNFSLSPFQCIGLGVGGIEKRAIVIGGGVGLATMATLSLVFDSSVISEFVAAKYLRLLKRSIEYPGILE